MKIIRQSWEFLTVPDGDAILSLIERAVDFFEGARIV
jgi:hypothetical protein